MNALVHIEALRHAVFTTCQKTDGLDWRDINKLFGEIKYDMQIAIRAFQDIMGIDPEQCAAPYTKAEDLAANALNKLLASGEESDK